MFWTAVNTAAANARGQMATSLQQKITTGVKNYYNEVSAGTVDPNSDEAAQAALDFASENNVDIMAIIGLYFPHLVIFLVTFCYIGVSFICGTEF